MSIEIPTELELAMCERRQWTVPIGPATQEQVEQEAAYLRYCEEQEAEYELQQKHGGRTVCGHCGQRAVKQRTVCTYGYAGHPGADYTSLAKCEHCGHEEM